MFWIHLINWWNKNISKENIVLLIDKNRDDLEECIIFGFPEDHKIVNILNLIILYAKNYIFRSKMKEKVPEFLVFLPILRNDISIEKKS